MAKLPIANKELGQHFLRDEKVISSITTDWEKDCDLIIEVGPGPAVLTELLGQKDKPLFLIEKDQRFYERLLDVVKNPEQIFMQDALKFEWSNFIKKNSFENKKIWLVSNLPYNVGTPLFIQFLQIPEIKYMTLMFQKEVGDKTYFRPEVKNQTSGLLVLSETFFNSKRLIKVAPGCFSPPPKVDSVVVSYVRKVEPAIPLERFKDLDKFTRTLFSQKRKQISSILKSQYEADKLNQAFEQIGILSTIRAEALTVEQIQNLFIEITTPTKC